MAEGGIHNNGLKHYAKNYFINVENKIRNAKKRWKTQKTPKIAAKSINYNIRVNVWNRIIFMNVKKSPRNAKRR